MVIISREFERDLCIYMEERGEKRDDGLSVTAHKYNFFTRVIYLHFTIW